MIKIPYGGRKTPISALTGLELTYTTGNAPTKTLAEWNNFFETNVYASTPFSSFTKVGDIITLFGATNLTLKANVLNGNAIGFSTLLKVYDYANCVVCLGGVSVAGNYSLTELSLPVCTITENLAGYGSLEENHALTYLYMPLLTTTTSNLLRNCYVIENVSFPLLTYVPDIFNGCNSLKNVYLISMTSGAADGYGWTVFRSHTSIISVDIRNCLVTTDYALWNLPNLNYVDLSNCTNLGGSTGLNEVFTYATGRTITIKIPHALESDGDIVNLKANNTVTIIYSD